MAEKDLSLISLYISAGKMMFFVLKSEYLVQIVYYYVAFIVGNSNLAKVIFVISLSLFSVGFVYVAYYPIIGR